MAVAGIQGEIWPAGGMLQPVSDCTSGGSCSGLLYEGSIWVFIIFLLIIAGGCALMAGRALAKGWRPVGQLMFYIVLFGLPVRFLHWGLFRGTLLSPYYYVLDTLILLTIALLGYRYTRANQMVGQYRWLYRRTGPFGWAARDPSHPA